MQSLSTLANKNEAPDLSGEILRLESLIEERRAELTDLQEEFREFKTRYTQVVGSRLSELAEVEAAIREAEAQMFGASAEDESDAIQDAAQTSEPVIVGGSFRKLFWSVARLFHPDHASDEKESRRRHAVMAEASRAYREGDAESLRALLGDEELQFFCTGAHAHEEAADLASRLVELKEELRTVEFGIRRLKQNGLYQLKLKVEEDAQGGLDPLAAQAERINRQIVKARRRLENLSS
jgi:hypothetical protein